MKTYHPGSWSTIARRIANNQIEQYKANEITFNDMIEFCQTSYRADIIKRRVAKKISKYRKEKGAE